MGQARYEPALADAREDAGHRQVIQAAHERSLAFGIAAHAQPETVSLSMHALAELRQRNARLCAHALPVMELLLQQLAHSQCVVLLSDASGVLLHAVGEPVFLQKAETLALTPGAHWAEADKGTNAVGTVLMTEAPALVHGSEHFLRALHGMSCAAAPILDHKGEVQGVLDVSGDRRHYHPHTLALATMAARLIEHQWFAERFAATLRLHLHRQTAGLGTLGEGQLALDARGQLLGADRRATELLGMNVASLRREGLAGLFAQTLPELLLAAHGGPGLRLQHRGGDLQGRLFQPSLASAVGAHIGASLDEPLASPAAPAALAQTPAQSLRRTESLAIRAAVQASGGNLTMAAKTLGIGRSTLYRKLREFQP